MKNKVCIECGENKNVSDFYVGKNQCKECRKEYDKKYREENKEKIRDGMKKYYEENKEKFKKYREENKEKIREGKKKYREENKEKIKKYREENKERRKEYHKKYYEENKECRKEYGKKYTEENKERRKECQKKYYEENKEKFKKYGKKYYEENKENIRERSKKYYKDNKENIIERNIKYDMERRKNDPLYRLTVNIKCLIRNSFKNKGYTKKSRSYKILGCSFEDFKKHIESQFEDWMNWDNYGLYNGEECYGWDFDHIIPVCSCECEEDVYKLNHYSNFQPLCSYLNRYVKKGNLDWEL